MVPQTPHVSLKLGDADFGLLIFFLLPTSAVVTGVLQYTWLKFYHFWNRFSLWFMKTDCFLG